MVKTWESRTDRESTSGRQRGERTLAANPPHHEIHFSASENAHWLVEVGGLQTKARGGLREKITEGGPSHMASEVEVPICVLDSKTPRSQYESESAYTQAVQKQMCYIAIQSLFNVAQQGKE